MAKMDQCALELLPQTEPGDDQLFYKPRTTPKRGPKVDLSKMSEDERFAWEIQNEEHRRYRMLHAQRASEMNAKKHNMYAAAQRVDYFHKGNGQHFEAIIIGVHLDDGFDKPYYVSYLDHTFFFNERSLYLCNKFGLQTIRYTRPESIEEDGQVKLCLIDIDKQTTPDRLRPLPWDEDKVYEALVRLQS